ncbi:MAG TPA: hypothetical protein VF377_10340 [Acidimicrobiia bacterium]
MNAPERADFANSSETLVTGLTTPDGYGRSSWVAHWLSDNEWRGGSGVQSQHFTAADFDVFRSRVEARGGSVRIVAVTG